MHNLPAYSPAATLLQAHVPVQALAYCVELWLAYPFQFKVTGQRKTKQGDYRYHKIKQTHVITVNGTLNTYAFLITYVHEIAHLLAFQQHGFGIAPHGKAWKQCFQQLMQPLLLPAVFPEDILQPLQAYMANPKASTCSDHALIMALQRYNEPQKGLIALAELQLNHTFRLNKRVFLKEQVKRTRAWCKEVRTGRYYTVAESALVEAV